jgi:hypothetical protein
MGSGRHGLVKDNSDVNIKEDHSMSLIQAAASKDMTAEAQKLNKESKVG